MKNLKFLLVTVLLGLSLVSCDPPPVHSEVGVDEVEKTSLRLTEEEDLEVNEDDN